MTDKSYTGLTQKEAMKRLVSDGENVFEHAKKAGPLKIFAAQFKDLMVLILLACMVVSFLMGEVTETIAIIVIVFVNALLGFIQEYKTERTLEALKEMAAPLATVVRDGKHMKIPASQIVRGDCVLLKAGDRVPADGKIVMAASLSCDESLLTGESHEIDKRVSTDSAFSPAIGRDDMVYMGTVVTKGRGSCEVVCTGMKTEMGKIAGMLKDIEEDPTPLQIKMDQLGKYIGIGCFIICAVVSLTGILRGENVFDMLLTGISLAVAAVPEGLPAIITISLALAIRRILKRNALVKRLHAVETMGSADIICSDKTGTLTENKMTVKELATFDTNLKVEGGATEKKAIFKEDGRRISLARYTTIKQLLTIAAVCNNALLTEQEPAALSLKDMFFKQEEAFQPEGSPTECALLMVAAKGGIYAEKSGYTRIDEIPFDSKRKRMSVIVENRNGRREVLTKGAPDVILELCEYYIDETGVKKLTSQVKKRFLEKNDVMAKRALRVMGFAYKEKNSAPDESGLIFVGLAGMIDPPRKEAYQAVATCRKARIKTVMITGDHKYTACAIAKDLKIMYDGDMVLTGQEIDAMSDAEFDAVVEKVSVFARVSPGHKLKIVKALKRKGHIVAMTGDGANDAPAVKEANIGISMGESGTDVTKEAASVILLDDNFATFVAAVEEGRVIYNNIRKFIRYLLSCNIGEVVTMFVGMLIGMPVALLPIQILLVNLATDGLPAIALGMEPADGDVMIKKPRSQNESVFSHGLAGTIIFRGILIGLTTLMVFVTLSRTYMDLTIARTGTLVALIATQLFHVFECKSESKGLFSINIFNNIWLVLAVLVSAGLTVAAVYMPFFQTIFSTCALTYRQLMTALGYSILVPILNQVMHFLTRKTTKRN